MTAMTVQTTALCLLWEQNIVGVVSSQNSLKKMLTTTDLDQKK